MAEEDDVAAELANLYGATRDAQRKWSDEQVRQRCENLNARSDVVVYAAWPDNTKSHGIDYEPLKGIELLDRGRTGLQYTKVVVPCDSPEQAIRIKIMFFSPESRSI
jgi:hypothetical protein